MKCILSLIIVTFCLTGCYSTTWECLDDNCPSFNMAKNKCLAQANSAFSRSKHTIWSQCMRGEGFDEKKCDPSSYSQNPCVPLGLHVM